MHKHVAAKGCAALKHRHVVNKLLVCCVNLRLLENVMAGGITKRHGEDAGGRALRAAIEEADAMAASI